MTRHTEKNQHKRNYRRGVTVAAVAVLCVMLLISPLFAVRRMTVSPMDHYSRETMESLLSEVIGRNGFLAVADYTSLSQSKSIFSMEMPELEEELLFALPYLEDVRVQYVFPNRLRVTAQERTASFLLEHYGIYLLVDTHGVVLETFTRDDAPDMPIVKGVAVDAYKIGLSIADGKDSTVDSAVRICNLIRQLSMEEYIDIVDVTDYNNIRMYCAPSLTVLFGDCADAGVRLTQLKGILNGQLSGESDGVLNLAHGGHATFTANEKPSEGDETA